MSERTQPRLGRPTPEEPWQGPMDEVDLDLGPERAAGGLLDRAEGSGSSTGDATVPRAESGAPSSPPESRRAALLARLMGVEAPDPARYAPHEGQPSEALRRRLAEESPDPVPLPLATVEEPTPGPAPAAAPPVALEDEPTRPWSAAELADALRPPAAPRRAAWAGPALLLLAGALAWALLR